MKKFLLIASVGLSFYAQCQFSSGTVNLPTTGMTIKLDTNPTGVTMTLSGDSNSMLAMGFGNSGMVAGGDGFIYSSAATRDYTFNGVGVFPSADVSQDWTVTSDIVSGTSRTITATRSLSGGSEDYALANAAGTVDIYYARRPNNLNVGSHGAGLNRDYTTLTMSTTLSTDSHDGKTMAVTAYPNPAESHFQLTHHDTVRSVALYDSTGKKLREINSDLKSINIINLTKGKYYLEISLKDGTVTYQEIIKK